MTDIVKRILDITNQGRDLIVECYPQFEGIADDKKVKLRDEKDASAHIHLYNGVYILKDFGDSSPGKNGIAVFAETHGMEYNDAIHYLAVRYGLDKNGGKAFGPVREYLPLSGTMKKGERKFEFKPSFTKDELRFLGPLVTEEVATKLHWHSVARMTIALEDKELVISSTPYFPIFARELHDMNTGEVVGYKIYQPRYQVGANGNNYKFSYYPSGLQPGTYVHGLYELERAKENGETIERVAIVSGERDALVAKSMGVYPIWLNSETKDIPPLVVNRLMDVAQEVYYIPDVDSTGKMKGMENIVLFPLLKTVWLPESIKSKVGDQSKPCKDLRDWAGMNPTKNDFYKLLNTAKSYQFWEKDDKGKTILNYDSLLYFLNMNGFWRIWNDITKEYEFVRIKDKIVTPVTLEEIRNFITEWSNDECSQIRNFILKNRKTNIEQLKDLPVIDVDFKNATKTSQVFCFVNMQVMVTDESIYALDKDSYCYFKEKKVIKHRLELLPSMFDVEEYLGPDGKKKFAIIPTTDKCKLFLVMQRTSSLFWQLSESGVELTQEQKNQEMACLASQMFSIGHLMHRFRSKSRDWAPLFLDNNTRIDSSVAEGGTGKNFISSELLLNMGYIVVVYNAKKKNPLEDDFIFDEVTTDTDVFHVTECPDRFEYDKFNSMITGSMTVNKKNKSRFTIPHDKAPKISEDTNFVPHDFGGSSSRRRLDAPVSDYYHYASPTNGYTKTRTIRDDFDMELMSEDYSWEDWNRDFNFALQCEQFYLMAVNTLNDKISPDMTAIIKRHNISEVSPEIFDWADSYFSNPAHLNTEIVLDALVIDYNQCGYSPKITKRNFKSQLKAWVACQDGLEFNPPDKCNDQANQRIKCKCNGKTTEKVYIAGKYLG